MDKLKRYAYILYGTQKIIYVNVNYLRANIRIDSLDAAYFHFYRFSWSKTPYFALPLLLFRYPSPKASEGLSERLFR